MRRAAPPSRPPRSARARALRALALLALPTTLAVILGGAFTSGGCGGSDSGAPSGSGGGAGGRGGAPAGSGGRTGSGGSSSMGSGGGSASSGGSTGNGSGGATSSGGMSGGASGGSPGCVVKLSPQSPMTFDIEAAPRVTMTVHATVMHTTASMPTWSWTITQQAGAQLLPISYTALDDTASTVKFPMTAVGKYQILATVNEDSRCIGQETATGLKPGPPSYTFRISAPGFPVQDKTAMVTTTPAGPLSLPLESGRSVMIRPRSQGQSSILPAYVRITSPAIAFTFEGDTAGGPVQTSLSSKIFYDLLVVPADPTFAPELLTALPDAWSGAIDLDRGIHVGGSASDADGKPLAGARVILRRDKRPSTIGISDGAGKLDLWTRSGALSVTALPPPGSGLAQANVEVTSSTAGIPISGEASLAVQWKATQHGNLAVKVLDVDGATPVAKARVRASAHPWDKAVATVTATVGGSTVPDLPAYGSVNEEAMTDAAGGAMFAALPVGMYDLTIVPPAGAPASTPAAITPLTVAVPAAGVSATATLGRKVALAGKLGPSTDAVGATVTAFDASPNAAVTSPPATTSAADDGSFRLPVDPGRSYELVIQPAAGKSVARAIVAPTAVSTADVNIGTVPLPHGRSLTVMVQGNGGNSVDRAFVQIFCQASSATCVDPAMPLAEGVTTSDGRLDVVLPDTAAAP